MNKPVHHDISCKSLIDGVHALWNEHKPETIVCSTDNFIRAQLRGDCHIVPVGTNQTVKVIPSDDCPPNIIWARPSTKDMRIKDLERQLAEARVFVAQNAYFQGLTGSCSYCGYSGKL